jgi:UPF0755 protein
MSDNRRPPYAEFKAKYLGEPYERSRVRSDYARSKAQLEDSYNASDRNEAMREEPRQTLFDEDDDYREDYDEKPSLRSRFLGGLRRAKNDQEDNYYEDEGQYAEDGTDEYNDYYDDYYGGDDGYDDRYGRERKGRWWIAPLIVLAVIIVFGIVAFSLYSSYQGALEPIDPKSTEEMEFKVASGATTDDIATALEEEGLTRKAFYFKIHSKLVGNDGRYREGIYALTKAMSMDKIMQTLIDGTKNTNVVKFTIPEGLTTKQTVAALVKKGLGTEEEFWNEIKNGKFDYKFLADAPKGENRLEGFLYPQTYEVFKQATPHDVIEVMLDQFDKEFTEEDYAKAKEVNLTVYEAVIVGSMIERETAVEDEKPLVARVIYNRLKINMRLQIDATIQYALPEVKKFLTYDDLKIDSPYNTYTHDGLPPTPICSPQISSIKAALYPADNDYLYYVMKPEMNGSHNFAATESEFNKYKKEYADANGL